MSRGEDAYWGLRRAIADVAAHRIGIKCFVQKLNGKIATGAPPISSLETSKSACDRVRVNSYD